MSHEPFRLIIATAAANVSHTLGCWAPVLQESTRIYCKPLKDVATGSHSFGIREVPASNTALLTGGLCGSVIRVRPSMNSNTDQKHSARSHQSSYLCSHSKTMNEKVTDYFTRRFN
jgi:hypothetical protein